MFRKCLGISVFCCFRWWFWVCLLTVQYCFKTTPLRGSTFDEFSLFGEFDFIMLLLCFSVEIWLDKDSICSVVIELSVALVHISGLSVDPLQISSTNVSWISSSSIVRLPKESWSSISCSWALSGFVSCVFRWVFFCSVLTFWRFCLSTLCISFCHRKHQSLWCPIYWRLFSSQKLQLWSAGTWNLFLGHSSL